MEGASALASAMPAVPPATALHQFTCNGNSVKLCIASAQLSKEFAAALENNTFKVHVPDLLGDALPHVWEYMREFGPKPHCIPSLSKPLPADWLSTLPWESEFLARLEAERMLLKTMQAAHQLKVEGLMELTCAAVSDKLSGLGDDDLPAAASALGHTPDFADDDKRQLDTERRHYTSSPTPAVLSKAEKSGTAFSVYLSSRADDSIDPGKDFSVIQRTCALRHWVPDAEATECTQCKSTFRPWKRKHHCRACGKIFCWDCRSQSQWLPRVRREICIPSHTVHHWWPWAVPEQQVHGQRVPVCDGCYKELEGSANTAMWETVLHFAGLLVPALWRLSGCSRVLRSGCMALLSRLREDLYSLPTKQTSEQFELLWANRHHFRGHSRWVVQLLKFIPHHRWADSETLQFMVTAVKEMRSGGQDVRRSNCWAMMCSRLCSPAFALEDVVEMLCDLLPIPGTQPVQIACVEFLKCCDADSLRPFLRLLSQLLRYETRATGGCLLGTFLQDWSLRDPAAANEFFWLLRVAEEANDVSTSAEQKRRYSTARLDLTAALTDLTAAKTDLTLHSFDTLDRLIAILRRPSSLEVLKGELGAFDTIENFGQSWPVVLPTAPTKRVSQLKLETLKVMMSNAQPVLLTVGCSDRGVSPTAQRTVHFEEEKTLLYKSDDVTVDRDIMGIIRYMKGVLQREFPGIEDNIITYDVVPTSSTGGCIEVVPHCRDLATITEEDRSIESWIREHTITEPGDTSLKRFTESAAAYAAIGYLIGVGDRHKHNMMITEQGQFFHIDYGYVLGQRPANLVGFPVYFRITKQMEDFLFGRKHKCFKEFQKLAVDIFHCLRRHYSIVMRMLLPLVSAATGKYTMEAVEVEMVKRFAPDQSDEVAEETFRRRMKNDMDRNDEILADTAHTYGVQATKALRERSQSIGDAIGQLPSVACSAVTTVGGAVTAVGGAATAVGSTVYQMACQYISSGNSAPAAQ